MPQDNKPLLSILLTTSPEHENTHTVVRLAEAALARGKAVKLFMMCDGVLNSYDSRILGLLDKGVTIAQCEHNAGERRISSQDVPIEQGSQYILSTILDETDRFLSFNS